MWFELDRDEAAQLIAILDFYSREIDPEWSSPLAWKVFDALKADLQDSADLENDNA